MTPGNGRLTADRAKLTEGALLDSGKYSYYIECKRDWRISTSIVDRRSICIIEFLDVVASHTMARSFLVDKRAQFRARCLRYSGQERSISMNIIPATEGTYRTDTRIARSA